MKEKLVQVWVTLAARKRMNSYKVINDLSNLSEGVMLVFPPAPFEKKNTLASDSVSPLKPESISGGVNARVGRAVRSPLRIPPKFAKARPSISKKG